MEIGLWILLLDKEPAGVHEYTLPPVAPNCTVVPLHTDVSPKP